MMNPYAASVLSTLATVYLEQRVNRAFMHLRRQGIIDHAECARLITSFLALAWREALEQLAYEHEDVAERYYQFNDAFMAEYALLQRLVDAQLKFDLLSALLGREAWNGPKYDHHVAYVAEITSSCAALEASASIPEIEP